LTAPAGAHAAKVALDGNANSLDAGLEAVVAFLGVAEEEYAQRCALNSRAPAHPLWL
jgi:hypothetical protein